MASLWIATLLIAVCLASAADVTLEEDVRNVSSPALPVLKRLKRAGCRETEEKWHVEGFREMISEAHRSGKAGKFSHDFTLNGYNAHLKFGLARHDGELWLGLFLGFCKGHTDQLLAWPFRARYALMIVHPTDETLDISNTISSFSTATFGSFKRPTSGCNYPRGFPKLIRVSEVEKKGYVVGNAISVGVKLNP
ncbi:TNF receptor-associated factor 5-like [Ornithodoros turicata]|uniref:TNF receptor-associated factor 5-like n=1 Tax=Ornithodoros turicata TaxID=34597 RepID=UPI003139FAC1